MGTGRPEFTIERPRPPGASSDGTRTADPLAKEATMRWIGRFAPAALLAVALAGCGGSGTSAHETTSSDASLKRVQKAKVLLWGADVVGGVPYVYEDPNQKGH